MVAGLLPAPPAHGLSTGRGGEALVLAMLDGAHALDKVGHRLAERGMRPLLQPGLPRAALHDDRFGPSREARCAAPLNQGLSAGARQALEGYAIPPPWLQQATTTRALSGV